LTELPAKLEALGLRPLSSADAPELHALIEANRDYLEAVVGAAIRHLQHHKVYSGVMSRIQVYLGEGELKLLERASRDTGASRSELIRRAVRTTFGEQGKDEKLRALNASAGSWRGQRTSGAEYVEAIRGGDLNERLARLGVK
jgi:Arc/MetJ-type ribon-helix-helix transcriptional regulator